MIGGLIKSNRLAVLAGSAFVAGALAVSPAQAADLGGDCCADLEERVAELEATTARKGNRKVSLTISGWVNVGLMAFDAFDESDAHVVSDNGTTLGSRFTFAGNAKIDSRWSAGYNITVEVQNDDPFLADLLKNTGSETVAMTQFNDDTTQNFTLLYSNLWIKHEELGTVTIGLQSQATDNISIVDLSGTLFSANNVLFRGNNFITGAGGATWGQAIGCTGIGTDCHGEPLQVIRYDSPTFGGFSVSASWGEDDFWDVAAKYAGEFGDIKVAAAIGYSEWDNEDYFGHLGLELDESRLLEGGVSAMHTPTGLFVSAAFTQQWIDEGGVEIVDADAWYVKAGIKQKWNSLGATAIYGEYGQYNNELVDRYGIGIHQWVDAAAMQIYFNWTHLEADATATVGDDADVIDGDELDTFTFGAVIFF